MKIMAIVLLSRIELSLRLLKDQTISYTLKIQGRHAASPRSLGISGRHPSLPI